MLLFSPSGSHAIVAFLASGHVALIRSVGETNPRVFGTRACLKRVACGLWL
jgi:hypothetical protein